MDYPKGTTKEQWDRYEKETAEFEKKMRACEPTDKGTELWNTWLQSYSMNAPNKPGYYRANND